MPARRWSRGAAPRPRRPERKGAHAWHPRRMAAVASSFALGFPALLLLGLQLLLGKLADQSLGQRVAELDLGRHLDLGDLGLQVPADVLLAGGHAGTQLDEGLGRLAAVIVLDADHRHLLDRRMLVDRLLDAARIDVVARADDEVLDAVDDED